MDITSASICKHVVVLGMNHTSSKMALRDRLLFNNTKLESALAKLSQEPGIIESFIISTCNRVELYAVMEQPETAREQLLKFFSEFHGIAVDEFEQHFYFYHCREAARHLFSVVSSLDSLVIGENQIIGQVKEAYYQARDRGTTGTILNKLYHFAIETGKRVRTETKIGDGILSISSAAVDLAKKILGDLSVRTALIIGAGEMSELTARHLSAAGIKKLYFANRTLENAIAIANQFGGTALLLNERESIIAHCDIIISSTGSPHYIITPDEIKKVMNTRKHQALFCIDIAAPRDIHPDVGRLQNVFLYSIDDLSQVVSNTSRMRSDEIGKARTIINEDLENYFDWYNSLKVLPTLVSLRKHFETIRDTELENYASKINTMPEPAQQLIRQIAASLTTRLLSSPSKTLKEIASEKDSHLYARSIATIFDLKVEQHD